MFLINGQVSYLELGLGCMALTLGMLCLSIAYRDGAYRWSGAAITLCMIALVVATTATIMTVMEPPLQYAENGGRPVALVLWTGACFFWALAAAAYASHRRSAREYE